MFLRDSCDNKSGAVPSSSFDVCVVCGPVRMSWTCDEGGSRAPATWIEAVGEETTCSPLDSRVERILNLVLERQHLLDHRFSERKILGITLRHMNKQFLFQVNHSDSQWSLRTCTYFK